MANIKLSWFSSVLKLLDTKKYGKGVFANKNIKKGELITAFGGYVISYNDFKRLPRAVQEIPYQISDKFLFGPTKTSEFSPADYYNHSCDPNSGFNGQLFLVAIKDIKKGEQVTFDYAMCMTSSILNLKCLCGSKKCRTIIKGTDWRIPVLQKRYKGYFQPYIQEKINQNKYFA